MVKKFSFRNRKHSLLTRVEMSIVQTGRKHTKKTKKKMSIARKIWHQKHPNFASEMQRGKQIPVEQRKKISDTLTGHIISKEQRIKQSIAMKACLKKRGNWTKGTKWTMEQKMRLKKIRKKQFQDPEFVRKVMRRVSIAKPTKLELAVQKWLDEKHPNEWKYCGDGSVILNGHCPDFINVNGKKQVILVNGNYWHITRIGIKSKKQAEYNERIPYNEIGFNVIFIWEDDIKGDKICL